MISCNASSNAISCRKSDANTSRLLSDVQPFNRSTVQEMLVHGFSPASKNKALILHRCSLARPNSPSASLRPILVDERLVRVFFLSAVSRNHDSTLASKRVAMSLLGSSPTVGRPTRRSRESCLSESLGIIRKSSSSTSYLVLSLRLAPRALMSRVNSSSSRLLMVQALH